MATRTLRNSILTLVLVVLTASIGKSIAPQHSTQPHPASPLLADAGGGEPEPPDPGPDPSLTSVHLD